MNKPSKGEAEVSLGRAKIQISVSDAASLLISLHQAGCFMIRPSKSTPAYLYSGVVDMRKSIDGLAGIVENELELNPLEPALFVFCNRGRDKIKILYWENNGFVLWYKRLEKKKFKWLDNLSTNPYTISGKDINRLLDGLNIFTGQPHEALFYEDMS